jgi:soluble lytic murein transglycosylase-like protein
MIQEKANRYGAIKELVRTFSRNHGINPELVAGVIYTESRGNPTAFRYEPRYFDRYIKAKKLQGYVPYSINEDSERNARATSWGLMQIMGETARERGFMRESLVDLADPEINLDFGCAYLRDLIDAHGGDTILALYHYNAGEGSEYPGPKPGDYPSRVLKAIDEGKALPWA